MSAFKRAWLDSTGSLSHLRLSDEDKQVVELVFGVDTAGLASPGHPDLHGVLEADLARHSMGDGQFRCL